MWLTKVVAVCLYDQPFVLRQVEGVREGLGCAGVRGGEGVVHPQNKVRGVRR